MKCTMISTALLVAVMSFFSITSQAAPTGGPKPSCPQGQVAVQKNGMWACEELKVTAGTSAERKGVEDRPRCPVGQIAKKENGTWFCKELTLKSQAETERKGIESRPRCPKGQIAQKINGDWFCKDTTIQQQQGPQE